MEDRSLIASCLDRDTWKKMNFATTMHDAWTLSLSRVSESDLVRERAKKAEES